MIEDREKLIEFGFEPDKIVTTMTIEQLYKLITLANATTINITLENVTAVKTTL